MEVHIARDHRPNLCPLCNKAFKRKTEVNKHLKGCVRKMKADSEMKAKEAGDEAERFKAQEVLNMVNAYQEELGIKDEDEEKGEFPCPLGCKTVFTRKESIQKHIKHVHEKYKPKSCDICGKAFRDQFLLRQHLRRRHKIAENDESVQKESSPEMGENVQGVERESAPAPLPEII